MVGLIIATSVLGTAFIATTVIGVIKIRKLEKNVDTLAQCLLAYMTNPNGVDVYEEYPINYKNGFTFPNSTGF